MVDGKQIFLVPSGSDTDGVRAAVESIRLDAESQRRT